MIFKTFLRKNSRAHCWSDSALARWIYDYEKSTAATMTEWKDIRQAAKEKAPFRYWVREDLLDNIQDIIWLPVDVYRNIYHYIKMRFVTKSHALTSTLQQGQWYDMDTRILHCLFDSLVEFIDNEKANMQRVFCKEESKGLSNREAGLAYLQWEMSLVEDGKLTRQAEDAIELYTLYDWWVNKRPNRKDAYDESGWSRYCDEKRDRYICWLDDHSEENQKEKRKILDRLDNLEDIYEKEDEEMLIRLIRLRKALWT